MAFALLDSSVERLRIETIGDPEWLESKGVFEYPRQTLEVAVVLKLVRAVQGVHALRLLCSSGLFVDMGAIYRCVQECVAETYFLLERYPDKSRNGQKFLAHFFSKTIDRFLLSEEQPVSTKKIHAAMVRVLSGQTQSDDTRRRLSNVYSTFSGYVHAGYAHIMQMYGGEKNRKSFNVSGVHSIQQREMHMEIVSAAHSSVLYAIAFAARKFELKELHDDVAQAL